MRLHITSAKQAKPIPASLAVNRIGKYLYKNLDGAIRFNTSSNTFDVYTLVLYQLPRLQQIPGKGEKYNGMHEMVLNLSITTYQNKIRVNIIEVSPNAKTIGFDVYDPEIVANLEQAKALILHKVRRRIQREYKEYNFLF